MKLALFNGQLVQAANCHHLGPFFCPQCGHRLVLVQGKHKQAYFAHLRPAKCNSEGETSLHQIGKQQMYRWACRQGWRPRLEVFLPQIQQRPDLLVQLADHTFVFEFQCSPLDVDRLAERNQGYRHLRMPFCWFLGATYAHQLRDNKIAQFTQWRQGKPVVPFWNVHQQRPIYRYDFRTVPFVRNHRLSKRQQYLVQTQSLQKMMRYHDQGWWKMNDRCYLAGHIMSACPLVAHPLRPQWPMLRDGEFRWRLRCLLLMESLPFNLVMPYQGWEKVLASCAEWLPMPCLAVHSALMLRQELIKQFIQELQQCQILRVVDDGLIYWQVPQWFADGGQKIRYIKTAPFN